MKNMSEYYFERSEDIDLWIGGDVEGSVCLDVHLPKKDEASLDTKKQAISNTRKICTELIDLWEKEYLNEK